MFEAKPTSHQTGLWAEELAAKILREAGYEILAERYKTRYGEIDLIVSNDDTLVFVEVKARQNLEDSLYAVTPKTRRRIEQSALHYISENPELADMGMRFDVIAVGKGGKDGGISVEHLDNAWGVGS